MRKNVNREVIEGYVYQHNLQIRTVERADSPNKGKPFISGTLDVATDESCTNVLQVHFTYVAENYGSGKPNATYTNLKRIIETGKTVIDNGIAEATKVSMSPSLALNDFYPAGSDELVSQMRNEGGFVNIVNELKPAGMRATFDFDVVLTGFKMITPEENERVTSPYAEIRGVAFDFRNGILPSTFVVRNPLAIKYFENLELSNTNPVYTEIKGNITSTMVTIETTSEGAFGEASVDVVSRRVREWEITWSRKNPYEFGEEGVLTVEELKKASEDRNVYLAEQKTRAEEYRARSNNAIASPASNAASAIKDAGFNF